MSARDLMGDAQPEVSRLLLAVAEVLHRADLRRCEGWGVGSGCGLSASAEFDELREAFREATGSEDPQEWGLERMRP